MHASLVEFELEKLPDNERRIGIDVGLEAFATLPDGTRIENHRYGLTLGRDHAAAFVILGRGQRLQAQTERQLATVA
jgi:hypothetical protein